MSPREDTAAVSVPVPDGHRARAPASDEPRAHEAEGEQNGVGTEDLEGSARVVLADGQVALLRLLRPYDRDAVLRLHQQLDEHDRYFRFFGPLPTNVSDLVDAMTAPVDAGHGSAGVFVGAQPLGVANYAVLADPTEAEIALAVSGTTQTHGIGTLLLEHLASLARRHGVRQFVAEVLTENSRMLHVFRACGLPCRVTCEGSVTHVCLSLDTETYLDAMGERERVADAASLRCVLQPRSLVVVGAEFGPESLGHAVLSNLIASGYRGQLHAVNPNAADILGVPCAPSVVELPIACELAVLCGPAAAAPGIARQCGQRGVRALIVISAGFDANLPPRSGLLAAVRRYGMRIVGPNCAGVSNSDPAISLDATFALAPASRGSVGLVTQSGAVGIALREQLRHLGLGLSTMVSTGDKYDVSGNDLLMWWRFDEATTAVVMCLESFGNPRKFGRLCQVLARTKPVLAIRTPGTNASNATSNEAVPAAITSSSMAAPTAAITAPAVTRDALFRQAGVIVVDTASEVVDTLAALSWQPLPTGNRIAVVTNADALAATASGHTGIVLSELQYPTLARLRALLPTARPPGNPVLTPASVSADTFAHCVAALLADPGVDAVLTVTVRTALGDPSAAIAALAGGDKPLLAVRLGQAAAVEALAGVDGVARTASYAEPAAALHVLGRLAEYVRWRRRPAPSTTQPAGVNVPRALAILRDRLRTDPTGGWLTPLQTCELLSCFGIPAPARPSGTAPGVPAPSVAAQGRELRINVRSDGVFGPLVEFGLGGMDADLMSDRISRLVPLGDLDIDELVHGLRCSPALFGDRATPALDLGAVRSMLARIALLAQLLPEVVELDLDPLLVGSQGCRVADARIRVAPAVSPDPFLPRLSG
ncbi:MAG: GNAT family N-acetyltransferase [Pseudonocardiales bacterium]|nr:GNAT family N-acetyltransferase [Pseudonocardiales bacterium]